MACTFNEEVELEILKQGMLSEHKSLSEDLLLFGCGGKLTKPKCVYEAELKVYGESCIVPVLVVPGQKDELILGTNVIKYLMHRMKLSDDYWRLLASGRPQSRTGCGHFLDFMVNTYRWRGNDLPDKVGTVKLQHSPC